MMRREEYLKRRIRLLPLCDEIKRDITREELIQSESLFRLVTLGSLKENILSIAGRESAQMIKLRRVYAENKVYEATVLGEEGERKAYAKEAGLQPDILAAELLREILLIVPDIRNVPVMLPGSAWIEYGVMQDIADADMVRHAVSLRGLARNKHMSELVDERFEEFGFILGHALEVCRMLGIQDRAARNVYIIEKTDGSLAIGMIDLDLVACYPDEQFCRLSFGGQLYDILRSLDIALVYGDLLRTRSRLIRKVLHNENRTDQVKRRHELINRMRSAFLDGARAGRQFFMDKENQEMVRTKLMMHEGKPVGLALNDRLMAERDNDEKPLINGRKQSIIRDGSNKGRFFLSWSDAWSRGFLVQQKEELIDFWSPSFRYAIRGIEGTVVY